MARMRRREGFKGAAMRFGLRRAHRNRADYVTLSPYAPPAVAPRGPARPDLPGIAGEILAKAEAAIDRLAAEYPEHARRDIADMENYATHMARDRNNRAAHYQEILRIAHDVRGQGALFGYPLMTRYAGSLCRATRLLEAHDRAVLDIVGAHVAAMRAILETGATGIEDKTALTIAAGLELLVSARARR